MFIILGFLASAILYTNYEKPHENFDSNSETSDSLKGDEDIPAGEWYAGPFEPNVAVNPNKVEGKTEQRLPEQPEGIVNDQQSLNGFTDPAYPAPQAAEYLPEYPNDPYQYSWLRHDSQPNSSYMDADEALTKKMRESGLKAKHSQDIRSRSFVTTPYKKWFDQELYESYNQRWFEGTIEYKNDVF